MKSFIKINPLDDVAVALCPLKKDETFDVQGIEVTLLEDIPQGHKFALKDIKENDEVVKYGYPIGYAKCAIKKGSHIHTHNLKTTLSDLLEYKYNPNFKELEKSEKRTFKGYVRQDGQVGVRNEIWIIPTVGCMNSVASEIEEKAQELIKGNVEAIYAFRHPYGCSQMGDDQENTRTILADLINHPNAGGVLVLGLGCENSNIDILKPYIKNNDSNRIKYLVAQKCEDEVKQALESIQELVNICANDIREDVDASKLVIGMKCGGSDGLSGISANPTVGAFSDLLISKGGTTILTEVPEMFGAETILMNRCKDKETFDKTVKLINDFKDYFKSHNQTIYENPSPGNKEGGISTLEDKSLGCTQKSGSAKVEDVLEYGERVKNNGLNLLSAPGNDLVAATALASSGCQIVLFTTGRGTPFASPVPTVKISSNTTLYNNKNKWIDFNCGKLVEGTSLADLSNELFEYVLQIASGEKTKSEQAKYHDLAIFKKGVTL